ncbi:MAG TPA: MFS transporter [Stellaceae bacterium]|nr:MFS transporter [Stellaceae bacterium]
MTTIAEPLTTGRIAARIDRLPLTWTQWRLALMTQLFWGIIVAVDGTPAKLYPFVWGPEHAFGLTAFSLLLAVGNGAGIIIGEYLISMVSDRWGRRTAMLVSALLVSLLLWPTALTNSYTLLMLFFFLSSFGIGGIISTSVVYMGEIVSPRQRGRIMLASQIVAVMVFGLLGNLPALFWVPADYQWVIYLYSFLAFIVVVPLTLWAMPESPRWLEAHGRHAQAEYVIEGLEKECLRRRRQTSLPEPDYAKYLVPVTEHVPMKQMLSGEYGRRTILLLMVWILLYSGMFYGFGGYEPSILHAFHLSSSLTFAVILVSTMFGGGVGLAFSSWLGERVERRKTILVSALVNIAALWAFFFVHSVVLSFVLITISWGAATTLLFNLYNYSAASYPTRLRTTGVGLTDGLGHLGAVFGPIVAGALYAATAEIGFVGWFAYITIVGALIPALLLAWFGINQRRAILEQIST